MDLTNSCPRQTVVLAKQGEYGNEFSWDATAWIEEFGAGSVGWLIQRPSEMIAYPLPDTEDGNISTIVLTETETQYPGKGVLEVFFVNTGETEKRISQSISFYIEPSLQNIGEVPEPWESYVDAVHADATSAEDSAQRAETAAEEILELTATASVSNTVGIPSVDVTVTEEDGHKNMDFSFQNLKGETGDCNFATFEIVNGELLAYWTLDDSEIVFSINNNGYLEVTI